MPNSRHNPKSDAGGLRTFLERVLPDAQLSNATVDAEYEPLLLMRSNHVLAAFAFSNGDIRKSYDALYSSFKNHCIAQRGQWDALDLAFVFCVQPDVADLDHFCSRIETDVYFCRKFVIPLAVPLEGSLARLPFLPLAPLHGRSLRPASAQTFLQQCNVPAVLAKFLVVQHERSPEGIVEDCASGKFGEPVQLTPVVNPPFVQSDEVFEAVRLETILIENFRAYRKPQMFAVGSDVTVLYGPNGFGKTSFFDAVDFAVTGGIGRIESRHGVNFVKAVQHLDSGSDASTVSVSFRCNGNIREVMRSVGDRKQALLDGQLADRKKILSELTKGDIPATDRVENFVNLFRASHLFSQEQQELTKDFQVDCRLSADVVSRMLAFQDYVNAVNKTAKVREVLKTTIDDANREIRSHSETIAEERKELERLGQATKAHPNINALDADIEALRAKLATAGVVVTTQSPDVTVLRGWRAATESRYGESLSASERLSVLAKEAGRLPQIRAELTTTQKQIAQIEQSLDIAQKQLTAAEQARQQAEQRLAQMTTKCAELQARAAVLEWVRATTPLYLQLLEKQHLLGAELLQAIEALALQRKVEAQAAENLRSLETALATLNDRQKINQEELAALASLQESLPSWQANRELSNAVPQSQQTELKLLESLRTEERELSPQVSALAAEEARLLRQIAEADKNQSELRGLVSALQGHVRTGTCPLCGEDHGSKDELLSRIQRHFAADAASGARGDLSGVRERHKQLAEQSAANKQQQHAANARLAALQIERTRLEAEVAQFVEAALKLRIVIEREGTTAHEQVQERIGRLQHELANLDRQMQDAGRAVEAARVAAMDARNRAAAKNADLTNLRASMANSHEETTRLRTDPRLTQVSLDMEPDQLADTERIVRDELDKLKVEAAQAESELNRKKSDASALRQAIDASKSQLSELRTQLSRFQSAVTQISIRIEEAKLSTSTSEEEILLLIAEQSRIQAQLLALRDSASNIELAIDAATTAAALTTMMHNVRNKERAIAQATERRDRHQPWLNYFGEVTRVVSMQQNDAIANFTREYGPRTSVIQRRLRSVYGFDEIEMLSHESTISVRVKRHGENLRPADFFSQSQQQTLLLGLFLTACSSQTWSAFAPVFLDDPVTHFDDLNTYAFLDLIVGLLESEFGRRQFVISTCDEKLLQLARQKFRHLGERATFYRFVAIGSDGPTVDQITS